MNKSSALNKRYRGFEIFEFQSTRGDYTVYYSQSLDYDVDGDADGYFVCSGYAIDGEWTNLEECHAAIDAFIDDMDLEAESVLYGR